MLPELPLAVSRRCCDSWDSASLLMARLLCSYAQDRGFLKKEEQQRTILKPLVGNTAGCSGEGGKSGRVLCRERGSCGERQAGPGRETRLN